MKIEQFYDIFKSESYDLPGVIECATLLKTMLQRLSFEVFQEKIGNNVFLIARKGNLKNKSIVFYSHFDVKPATEKGWYSNAFFPVIRDGRLYVRGAGDAKGQIFTLLNAIEKLNTMQNISLILDGGEERGSEGLDIICNKYRSFVNGKLLIILDSHWIDENMPIIALGTRGQLSGVLVYEDEELQAPVHAGAFGEKKKGAIYKIMKILNVLETQEFYNEIINYGGCVSICGMHSGLLNKGLIPNIAKCNLDIRTTKEYNEYQIKEKIIKFFDTHNCKFKIRQMCPAFKSIVDQNIINIISESIYKSTSFRPVILDYLPAYLPMCKMENLNIPMCILPIAQHDENNHSANENIKLLNIEFGEKIIKDIIQKLSEI